MNNMVNARKLGIGKLALLALGAAVGGCTEEANRFSGSLVEIGLQQAVISSVRTEIEGPRTQNVYVGGSQAQPNVFKTPESSYFDITGDGVTHRVIPGVEVTKYVNENPEQYKDGYEAEIYDASTHNKYKILTGNFRFK